MPMQKNLPNLLLELLKKRRKKNVVTRAKDRVVSKTATSPLGKKSYESDN